MTGKRCRCPDRFRSVVIRGLQANVEHCGNCGATWLQTEQQAVAKKEAAA